MKKVLVWDLSYTLKNSGGPAGYLYNIKEYLCRTYETTCQLVFLKDLLGIPNIDNSMNAKHKKLMNLLYKIDILSLLGYYRAYRSYKRWSKSMPQHLLGNIDINSFDVIHFHNSCDLYRAITLLEGYNGKIVLTSHSPQPQSSECVDNIRLSFSFVKFFLKKRILNKELCAWEKATFLMFPVEDALEPYLKEDVLREYKENNSSKFVYCESSILNKPISEPLTKRELGIDDNKILVCYIGRHNNIKGYDQLKQFASVILKNDDRFVFIIAGNEQPLKRLDHPNWIELGWINYGHRLISASDIFILPNKETYFDLVTLEVMREGTPILMSRTGGNKYFKKFGEEFGFYLYNYGDLNEQVEMFYKMIAELQAGTLNQKSINIRKLFEDKFTIEHYIHRYSELICRICN